MGIEEKEDYIANQECFYIGSLPCASLLVNCSFGVIVFDSGHSWRG